jgi:dihydrofolate synthase/folylpolyglutamate synthase
VLADQASADPAAARLAPLLAQLVNYERSRPDRRLWDLATMRALLQRSGALPPPRPAVQVAGSKGKGTTGAFLEALARAAGALPGFYSSPHVQTLLERIRLGGEQVQVEPLERALAAIVAAPGAPRAPTFFEAMTLAAAELFARASVGLAIYEVGLGGRFDATTALPVDASIVTTIELEHTELLGDTVAAIAAEKAAVIRPGGLGVTGTTGDALDVIRRHARDVGARLFVLGEDFGWRREQWDDDGYRAVLALPDGRELATFLPRAAAFEVHGLALAAAAFAQALPAAPLALDPAPRPDLPCRFEVRRDRDGEIVVLDGAHTERSLLAVAVELRRRFRGQRWSILFGSAAGKRWREALPALLPLGERFCATAVAGTQSEDPAAIAAWLREHGARCEVARDAAAGLDALRAAGGPRLAIGSFYLAGEVRRLLPVERGPAA